MRRWRAFFSQKRAWVGLGLFGLVLIFSMTAEFWSHQSPLILIRQTDQGSRFYFPAFYNYSVAEFGITDSFVVDFPKLIADDLAAGKKDWAIFPLNRWDPYFQGPDVLAAPSHEHWLGTDSLGRDVFARLIYGIRVSLAYGMLYWLFSFFVGIIVGGIQGYFAGKVDFVTERVKELAEIMPILSVVILVNGLTKSQSFTVTLGVVLIFAWIHIASQMRAQFLSLRKRDFCEAARAMGCGDLRIIFQHILPNAITPILTLTPFAISSGIAILTVLDYLGYGLNPPTPSIGEMLQQGRTYISNAPWLIQWPTASLAVMLISINLVGEALRQAFDPKSQ
mgnify:CR=1 FL=1